MSNEIEQLRAEVERLRAENADLNRVIFTNSDRRMTMHGRFFRADCGFISDVNFDFDAGLRVSGDFIDDEKDRYAQMVACTLNDYQRLEKDNAAQSAALEKAKVALEKSRKAYQSVILMDFPVMADISAARSDATDINKAIAAIEALPAPLPDPWLPIETAPKDGTKILGWNAEYGWRETKMNFYGEGSIGYSNWKRGKGSKEIGWDWTEPMNGWGLNWKPTHWMPLPAAPKGGE